MNQSKNNDTGNNKFRAHIDIKEFKYTHAEKGNTKYEGNILNRNYKRQTSGIVA